MLSTDPPSQAITTFSVATKAAIAAYDKSGRMVDAALTYAAHGFSVFPVTEIRKTPIPPRDKDSEGNPIGGTGGFKKATTDPEQIRKWWWKNQRHLIGVPMGDVNKIWTLDVDTTIEHDDDGISALEKLETEHGKIKTVAPPSRRKGKAYIVSVDIDPVAAPDWLYDLIGRRPSKDKQTGDLFTNSFASNDGMGQMAYSQTDASHWDNVGLPPSSHNKEPFTDIEELRDALSWIPNNLD
jgi:hypothetical protein